MVKNGTWILLPLAAAIVTACSSGDDDRTQKIASRLETEDDAGTDTDTDADADAEPEAGCAHPVCATGSVLDATCDPCATQVCGADPYCCNVEWDVTCVAQVKSLCGLACTAPPPPPPDPDGDAPACAHPVCGTGAPLEASCDACAMQVCAVDPYCCAVEWDTTCVSEVTSVCGGSCQ